MYVNCDVDLSYRTQYSQGVGYKTTASDADNVGDDNDENEDGNKGKRRLPGSKNDDDKETIVPKRYYGRYIIILNTEEDP